MRQDIFQIEHMKERIFKETEEKKMNLINSTLGLTNPNNAA